MDPDIAVAADGSFVVAWASFGSTGSDYLNFSIQARRFSAAGSPLSEQFQVNTFTPNNQTKPSVDVDAAGNFVIVWESEYDYGGQLVRIQGQRYDADGVSLGGEFRVDQVDIDQRLPAIALKADGEFMVAWRDAALTILGRLHAANGVALGDAFNVDTTGGFKRAPAIAADGSGNFVVAWSNVGSAGTDTSDDSIQGQRFNSDGTPQGSEFQVNSYTTGAQGYPSVATDTAGNFVIAWFGVGSAGTDTDGTSIHAQRYSASGVALGDEFQVNSYTTGSQSFPWVISSAEGDFVVSWASVGSDGSDTDSSSIQARYFAQDGVPVGAQFQVNTYTTGSQVRPKASRGGSGPMVITWVGSDTEGTHILAQRFAFFIFADGFESGDTSAWSSSQ